MFDSEEMNDIVEKYSSNISYALYLDDKLAEGKNIEKKFPAASIIKPFLMYYVLRNTDAFTSMVNTEDLPITNDSMLRFFYGDMTLESLLSLMIDVSDNTAANYFLDRIGISTINVFLKQEGFTDTEFQRRFLDFEARKNRSENTTSVKDLKRLLDRVFHGNELSREKRDLFDSIMRLQADHSKCSLYLPESLGAGGKSGALDNVWNDFIYFHVSRKMVFIAFLTHDLPLEVSREIIPSYCYRACKGIIPNIF